MSDSFRRSHCIPKDIFGSCRIAAHPDAMRQFGCDIYFCLATRMTLILCLCLAAVAGLAEAVLWGTWWRGWVGSSTTLSFSCDTNQASPGICAWVEKVSSHCGCKAAFMLEQRATCCPAVRVYLRSLGWNWMWRSCGRLLRPASSLERLSLESQQDLVLTIARKPLRLALLRLVLPRMWARKLLLWLREVLQSPKS